MSSSPPPSASHGAARMRLLATVLLLIAFALRVFRLEAQSLWYDEGVTAWLARRPWAELLRWTANDIQPPLAYMVAKVWGAAAGWNEYALRFLPVAFSLLTVALLYALLRQLAHLGQQAETHPVTPESGMQRRNAPLQRAALWAALLAAVHPLLVYYAQEARMYAQLGALVTLAACLLAPALFGEMSWRRWLAFAVTMALAAYTHYFAFFALAAFAVAWLWQRASLPRPQRGGWTRWLAAHALMVALFAPWLGVMLRRWGVDASYWQGQLKSMEALRDVAQRFVTGETMRDASAIWPALAVLLATLLLATAAWRTQGSLRPLLRLALAWVLVPVLAVIALAASAPKFNPRYVYLALPGLIVLWATILAWLSARPHNLAARPRRTAAQSIPALAMAALLLLPMLAANANWFFNGAFTKAQWRELTAYLRPRLTAEERVLLVSGHAWPVWDYYAPDIPVVRLPDLDVLDVEQVLTFASTAPPLREALETHPGAWLVQWQDEVVDPNEIVRTQLELGGREKGSSATFSQLELDRFSQIRTARISDSAPISVTVAADFGGVVEIAGYRPLDNGDLLLFWQLPASTDADLQMALEVLDAEGEVLRRVADRRLAGYNYPTFRWQPGDVNMARVPIEAWLGFTLEEFESGAAEAEPSYQLRVRVYDGNDPAHTPLPVADGDALLIDKVRPILE